MKATKTYLTLLALLLLNYAAVAQKGEPVIIIVIYQFSHVDDLNNPKKPYQQEMILRLANNESKYSNWTNEYKMKEAAKKSKAAAASGGGGPRRTYSGTPVAVVKSEGITDIEIFQLPKERKLVRTSNLGMDEYFVETALPKIDWKINQERKQLGIYNCQKATGSYAGRTYTVWFAPELPFQNGPWKLSGLPGLILEASDAKNEVSFLFKELSKGEEMETTASALNRRPIKVAEKAYERAKKIHEVDPVGAFQAQIPANGPKVSVAYIDGSGQITTGNNAKALIEDNKKKAKLKKANPIELVK